MDWWPPSNIGNLPMAHICMYFCIRIWYVDADVDVVFKTYPPIHPSTTQDTVGPWVAWTDLTCAILATSGWIFNEWVNKLIFNHWVSTDRKYLTFEIRNHYVSTDSKEHLLTYVNDISPCRHRGAVVSGPSQCTEDQQHRRPRNWHCSWYDTRPGYVKQKIGKP